MKQHATMVGQYWRERDDVNGGTTPVADHPEEPEGDGWRMVGSAAADGLLFWFWEREVAQ